MVNIYIFFCFVVFTKYHVKYQIVWQKLLYSVWLLEKTLLCRALNIEYIEFADAGFLKWKNADHVEFDIRILDFRV